MPNIVFTIVAKNYIGLAQVLGDSVKKFSPGVEFIIVVADEADKATQLPANALLAKEHLGIPEGQWEQLAFKYNLVEFCTAIKPFCFEYFFNHKNAGKVIYLDPDILAFNSLLQVFSELENKSILITPHILQMYTPFKGDYPDHLFLVNGIFNLGFIAVNHTATADQFIQWWQNRMLNGAYFDNDMGLATDQKWINFLPAIVPQEELVISRNAGLNAAPWNFFERELYFEQGKPIVKLRQATGDGSSYPLIFVHFSGYNYKSIINKAVAHKTEGFEQYDDWKPAFDQYSGVLENSNFLLFVELPYTYNFFANGKNILSLHRRIYRRLCEFGEKEFDHPFDTGVHSFYSKLKGKHLIDPASFKKSADSVTHKSIKGFNSKLKWVNKFCSFLQRAIGVRRYSMLLRFLRRYSKEENQYFLLDAQKGNRLL